MTSSPAFAFALAPLSPVHVHPVAAPATCSAGHAIPRRARALRRAAIGAQRDLDTTLTRYRYGASSAFDGLRRSAGPHMSELMGRAREFGDGFGGWGGGRAGQGGDGDGEDGEEFGSWGVAPGVHVVMRGKCDDAFRKVVEGVVKKEGLVGFGVDPAVPLVILLSWMGADARALKRYRAFYEARGYDVHVVMNGMKTAMFPPASKKQAQHVADVIECQVEGRPVFVHAFSIGTGIYGLALDSLKGDIDRLRKVRERVAGVVFDSGPAPIFPHDVAKGLHTVCPMVSKAVWEGAARAFFYVTRARASFEKGENALGDRQFKTPQLYFYSKDDKVIPGIHNAVEGFIQKNRQRGIEVYRTFWEKSVHATHLKIHPKDYLGDLDKFLGRCMEVRALGNAI